MTARGFTAIPNAVLRDATLPMSARMVYAVILGYAWGPRRACTRSADDLATETGIGRSAFFEAVKVLRERGMLEVEKRRSRSGWANAYVPVVTFSTLVVEGEPDEEGSPDTGRGVVRVADGGSSATRTQKKTKGEEDSETEVSEIARDDQPASMSYRGKRVPKAIVETASRSVRYFAGKTGQELRVVDGTGRPSRSLTLVAGAMLAHPELADPEFAKRTIDFALAAPWWKDDGPPGVGVVFGPNVVERMVEQARRDVPPTPAASGPGGRASVSDLLRMLDG